MRTAIQATVRSDVPGLPWLFVVLLVCATGCAYTAVDPDPRAKRFAAMAPAATPVVERALVVVNGAYYAFDARVPGAALSAEKRMHAEVSAALRESGVVRAVSAPPDDGELQVLVDFILEDDVDQIHRTFSMLTLYAFPMWKMVRLSARARLGVGGETLPTFRFESEVHEYRSPLFLVALPFNGPKPIARLCREAAQSLAVHVTRMLEGRRTPNTSSAGNTPDTSSGTPAARESREETK